MRKYYQVTLNSIADSFLGIQIEHDADGSMTLLQPKLLAKLFHEYPASATPYRQDHPYGPTPPKDYDARYNSAPKVSLKGYLHLLGILMYLNKSRPDISAAVSFGTTKAIDPNARDQQSLLYIVEYFRKTAKQGHRIYAFSDQPWQLYCTVDASYLLHPDSKGHTGYTLGLFREGTFYNWRNARYLHSCQRHHLYPLH